MLSFLTDEDFNEKIVRGLLRRNPDLDIVTVKSAGLSGKDDPTLLEWAASQGRVVVTHDVNTMTRFAYQRVNSGKPMPGVIEVSQSVPISVAIEELLLLAEYSEPDEWQGQVQYIPMR